jgi:hypothetical protein
MGLLLLVEEMGGLLHQHKVILNKSALNEANWLVETISCNLPASRLARVLVINLAKLCTKMISL